MCYSHGNDSARTMIVFVKWTIHVSTVSMIYQTSRFCICKKLLSLSFYVMTKQQISQERPARASKNDTNAGDFAAHVTSQAINQ